MYVCLFVLEVGWNEKKDEIKRKRKKSGLNVHYLKKKILSF